MLFAPADLCPPIHLYLIQRGIALYRGRLLSTGRAWGEDMVMSSVSHRKMYVARAMTFLEVHTITRSQLLSLAERYPAVFNKIRWACIWWALKRELIILGAFVKADERKSRASAGDPEPLSGNPAPPTGGEAEPSCEKFPAKGFKRGSTFVSGMQNASDSMIRDSIGAGALAIFEGGDSSTEIRVGVDKSAAALPAPPGLGAPPAGGEARSELAAMRTAIQLVEDKQIIESAAIMQQLAKLVRASRVELRHRARLCNL